MWKVTIKGLMAHKLRFVLTALAVILGVSFISGTFVLTATIQQTFDDLFANIYKGTDAVVRTHEVIKSDFAGGLRPPVPESLLAQVKRAPGVAAAAGTVGTNYAQVVDKNGKAIGDPNMGPPSLGFAWNPVPRLNSFRLVGNSSPPRADDEIVIDKATADKGHLKVGDQATVLTSKPPKKYNIVGVARFGTVDNLAGASIVLFTLPEVQRIADKVGRFDEIGVVAKSGVSQEQLKVNLQKALPKQFEAVTGKEITKENQDALHKNLSFITKFLLVFAIIALIVGSFIIYNTFSIVIAQRLREMALLRAIGASRTQVLASVMGESIIVGLVASAVGVVAGVGLAVGIKAAMSAIGIDIPGSGVVIPLNAVIIGIVVGTVVTILSSVVPARQAARIPPIAAMRDVALERPVNQLRRLIIGIVVTALGVTLLFFGLYGNSGLLAVGGGALVVLLGVFILSPLFARALALAIGRPLTAIKGIAGNLARENAARNPRRTATTAAAVMISVSLVGFITIFAASANASIGSTIDESTKFDYIVSSGASSGLSPQLARDIAKLPVISAVTPVRFGPAKVVKSTTLVVAIDPKPAAQMFDLGDVAGTLPALTDGIAVSKKTADDKHWKLGQQIPVTFVKTGPTTLALQYIYKEVSVLPNNANYLISLPTYEKNFDEQLDLSIFAKLKPGVSAAEGRAAIAPLLKAYPTAKLQDSAQYKADQKSQVTQILNLIYVLLLVAVVISVVGIANTLSLSIYERTREIGLVRAVGASRRQVRTTVRWESVIISLLGTVLGMVIAVFFSWAVVKALSDEGINKLSVPPVPLIIWVLVFGVLAVVAAIRPARRAAKLDVLKAISE